jgi:hypothetical protein
MMDEEAAGAGRGQQPVRAQDGKVLAHAADWYPGTGG